MAREGKSSGILGERLKVQAKRREAREKIHLGRTIRELREKAGLSGVELSRRSGGMDPRTLNAIEKGRIRNPSLDRLERIARGLGCLVSGLFIQAEMDLDRTYHPGSPKGIFQMEFPKWGLKVVSSTPPIQEFFCGKLILAPHGRVPGELLSRPSPVFLEVVIGRIEVEVEHKKLTLSEGENLFFNGGLEHSFRNTLNRESALWLVTAPSFFRS